MGNLDGHRFLPDSHRRKARWGHLFRDWVAHSIHSSRNARDHHSFPRTGCLDTLYCIRKARYKGHKIHYLVGCHNNIEVIYMGRGHRVFWFFAMLDQHSHNHCSRCSRPIGIDILISMLQRYRPVQHTQKERNLQYKHRTELKKVSSLLALLWWVPELIPRKNKFSQYQRLIYKRITWSIVLVSVLVSV